MLPVHCIVQYATSRSRAFFSEGEAGETSVVYPLFASGISRGQPSLWACACMCVHSKRQAWLSSACRISKDAGSCWGCQGGFQPPLHTTRHMHTRSKKGAAVLTIDLTGPHGDERTAGSHSKTNPFIYLNPQACGQTVHCRRGGGVYTLPSWWTCE